MGDYVYALLLDQGWVKLDGLDMVNGKPADEWAAENMGIDQALPNSYLTVKHKGQCYTLHPSLLASKRE